MAVKKKKSVAGSVIFVIILAALVVGAYFLIMNKDDADKSEIPAEQTEIMSLMDKDIENNYPATVREVVKLFCRYTKCLYNEEMTSEEMKALTRKLRLLYDEKLLEQEGNSEEAHFATLERDISHYHANEMLINSYGIDKSDKVVYEEFEHGEIASINMYFTVKEKTYFNRTYEVFKLHKDDDGRWKIYQWKEIDRADVEEE